MPKAPDRKPPHRYARRYTLVCVSLKPWSIIISYCPLFFRIYSNDDPVCTNTRGEKKEKHCVGPDPFGCSSQLHPTHCGCFCKQMARNYGFCFHVRSTFKDFFFLFLTTDNVNILGSWKLLVVFNEIAIVLKYIVCRRRAE